MMSTSNPVGMADPNVIAGRLLQKSYNRDGLPEIVTGVFLVLASALIYAMAVLPNGSLAFGIAVLSFSFGLPALFLGMSFGRWIPWVRRRYLIPREGYVQYTPIDKKYWMRGTLIGLTSLILMTVIVLVLPPPGSWFVALTGILGGFLTALCGRLPRFLFAGILTATAGVLLAYVDVPMELGMAALFGFQGVLAFISGGVTLVRFFSQPSTGAESDECHYSETQRN